MSVLTLRYSTYSFGLDPAELLPLLATPELSPVDPDVWPDVPDELSPLVPPDAPLLDTPEVPDAPLLDTPEVPDELSPEVPDEPVAPVPDEL